MAGEFGTATGVVLWFDRSAGVGKILGLLNGNLQAYFDSDGTIKAAGGQIVLDETGIRLLFSGGSGYGVDAYGSGPFGGPVENILQFEFMGGSTWFALSHAEEDYLDVSVDTASGTGGYPTKWRYHESGAYVLPKMTAAPALPQDGMLAYADGTSWNPGSGEGVYIYKSGGWTFLGGGSVADGSITTAKLADGAVTTIKIADDAVDSTKLAPAAVDTTALADGSVTSAKIAADAVTAAKIAAASVGSSELADGSVTSAKIAADAVTAAKIAASAVGTSELVDASVTTAKIADYAVTRSKLAVGAASAVLVNYRRDTDASTTSTSFVTLSSHSFTTRGGPIIIIVSLPFYNAYYQTFFDIMIDSYSFGGSNGVWKTSITAQHQMWTFSMLDTPTAGAHTLYIRWKTGGGTLYMYAGTFGIPMRVQVLELS